MLSILFEGVFIIIKKSFSKNKIKNEIMVGTFLKITDPAIVEIAGYAGFDFVIIDMEHGPISLENCQNMIRAAEKVGLIPIVRVAENNEKKILQVLDIGSYGVEVPDINTKEQAEALVRFAYYSPKGERGVCKFVRAAQYTNIKQEKHFEKSNNIITIAHIEGEEGIRNLEGILEVEGLDIIFIGPYDLSQSMGIPGQTNDPVLINQMEEITEKCKQKNKVVGTFVESPEMAKKWVSAGVQYIAYSVDVGMIYQKFVSVVQKNNEILADR